MLLLSSLRQALGHHRRDAVAHGDAVEGVRDLHRALLVSDDDQLRGLLQLLEDGEQARQVHVVQGGPDLVHNVERGRARLEDRDQERNRGQGTLAARQQRQALDLLARGPSFDLDARREHVVRVGEHQVALAARE